VKRAGGLSLVEVIVFSAILLGLLTVLSAFLIRGKEYFRQTESYALAQREASKVIRQVTTDLYRATEEHFTLESGQVSFLSSMPDSDEAPVDFDPVSGGTRWQRWVCYQHDSSQEVAFRTTIPLDTPTSDIGALPVPEFADFLAIEAPDRKIIGKGVERLMFSKISDGLYQVKTTTRFNGDPGGDDNRLSANVSLETEIRIWNTN
jgi:hypothetical protein